MYKPVVNDHVDERSTASNASSLGSRKSPPAYWPAALRISWLLTILCFILALIAGLEVGVRRLPAASRTALDRVEEFHSKISSAVAAAETELLNKRDPQTSATNPNAFVAPATTITTRTTSRTSSRSSLPLLSYAETTTPEAYVGGRSTTASSSRQLSGTAAPKSYVDGTSINSFQSPTDIGTFAPTHNYIAPSSLTTSTRDGYLDASRTTSPAPTATAENAFIDSEKTNQGTIITWPKWQIFVANYLPVLLAVVLRILWTPILANARLIQPFIAMMRPGGASLRHALFTGYLSHDHNPIPMLQHRSWLSLAALPGLGLILLMQPFSSEVVFLDTKYECPDPDFSKPNPCWPPRISIDPGITRALQALLALTALVCVVVITAVVFAPSPTLSGDPSSIAGIASLSHHPVLLHDFRAEKPDATSQHLKRSLPDRRYALQHYLTSDGQWKFGIVPVAAVEYGPVAGLAATSHIRRSQAGSKASSLTRIISLRDFAITLATAIICIALLGLIVAYYVDGSDSSFNRFFNSDTFGPRFVLTAMATMVSMGFSSLYQDVALTAPYHRLRVEAQSSASTVDLSRSSLPHISMFAFLRHLYLFPAAFSVVAVLSDVLVILAPVIPFSPGRMWEELLISCYTCMGILSLMILCIIGLVFWRRRLTMPRKPDTIGAVISYLCASRGLDDYCDERADVDLNHVKYTYDRLAGVDGVTRWMVDAVG